MAPDAPTVALSAARTAAEAAFDRLMSFLSAAFTAERDAYMRELDERDARITKLEAALGGMAQKCAQLDLKLEAELAAHAVTVAKLEVRVIQGEINRARTGTSPAPALDRNLN
jgi:hypothetical protein